MAPAAFNPAGAWPFAARFPPHHHVQIQVL
jgi:hypothetical protein